MYQNNYKIDDGYSCFEVRVEEILLISRCPYSLIRSQKSKELLKGGNKELMILRDMRRQPFLSGAWTN